MPVEESRREIKQRVNAMLKTAEVSPKAMTALYLGLCAALSLIRGMLGDMGLAAVFFSLLMTLLTVTLDAGFFLYCMTILRGERAEYLTLFDGFDSALKVALLSIVRTAFILLWYPLFLLAGFFVTAALSVWIPAANYLLPLVILFSAIPPFIVYYSCRFALPNLLDNPDIGILEAIRMSRRQALGWKKRLFALDLSYAPWFLLEQLPSIIYNIGIGAQLKDSVSGVSYTADNFLDQVLEAFGTMDARVFGIPTSVWLAFTGVWALAVAIFWRASHRCAVLEYFEAAKRASGVGEGAAPWEREEFYQQ